MSHPLTIALIAGETSGDQLGGWLMAALHQRSSTIRFIGLGGDMMAAQGLVSLFPMREIALMGFAEILPHIFKLKHRIREMVDYIEREKPDILITIDSPGFVLRVVKQLRARGIAQPKFLHYVAPTVWAYKPERAKKMAENFDYLLCLLPFEPPYFDAVKLPNRFIGHEIAWWWKSRGDGAAFRTKHALGDAPLLAVFPGSRNGEITRLWPIFKAGIERIKAQMPSLQVVIQVQPNLLDRLRAETAGWAVAPLIISNTEDKKDLFAAATAAIAKSGTIGLECALAGLPSIVAYRASPITAMLLRRMIKVSFVNLGNLLVNHRLIPELIQEDCTAENIAQEVLPLLNNLNAREAQLLGLKDVADMLGVNESQSPSEKAADVVMAMVTA